MYCLCSEKSLEAILAQQRSRPLPLQEMLAEYTSCLTGCGSCIPVLRQRLEEEKLLIDAENSGGLREYFDAVP